MTRVLYELVGRDDRRFSPFCWRARMALAHKSLDYATQATPFTQVPLICDGQYQSVPVLEDGARTICDSTLIADYLEETYPDKPSLFAGEGGRALSTFMHTWTGIVLHQSIAQLVLLDIYDHALPEDKDYFRANREKRFGKTLEAVQAGREQRVETFRDSLLPLRLLLKNQAFLGGGRALYADYIVFGALQWARVISPFKLLSDDDSVNEWFNRCLDLFDGLGRAEPGYY